MKYLVPIIVIAGIGIGGWFLFSQPTTSPDPQNASPSTSPSSIIPELTIPPKTVSPEPEQPKKVTETTSETTEVSHTSTSISASVLLKEVQFASQAPLRKWDEEHEEFCEEAAAFISASYALGKKIPNANGIDAELYRIKAFEDKTFGYYKDTTALETSRILKEFYGLTDVSIKNTPTIDDLKMYLTQGSVIMVPTAGRMLGNPYFTGEGPLYHMIVLKGYTSNGYFITQDPGTNTKGENYMYKISTIMNAMHDWNGGDPNNGAKVVIVVGKQK